MGLAGRGLAEPSFCPEGNRAARPTPGVGRHREEAGGSLHRHQQPSQSLPQALRAAHPLDEVLHFTLQSPPLKLDRHQLVGAHFGTVLSSCQLLLREQNTNTPDAWGGGAPHFLPEVIPPFAGQSFQQVPQEPIPTRSHSGEEPGWASAGKGLALTAGEHHRPSPPGKAAPLSPSPTAHAQGPGNRERASPGASAQESPGAEGTRGAGKGAWPASPEVAYGGMVKSVSLDLGVPGRDSHSGPRGPGTPTAWPTWQGSCEGMEPLWVPRDERQGALRH